MNYSSIELFDICNGNGIRVSLFVSGCKFHCKGCFNEAAQQFNNGKLYTEEEHQLILEKLKDPNYQGLSILGGDPLWQDQVGLTDLTILVKEVHKMGKDVWLWTGFTWEEIFESRSTTIDALRQNLIRNCDVVIDGRFEEDKKDLSLVWKGSSNQRIIDVKKSFTTRIKNKKVHIIEPYICEEDY